MTGSVRTPGAGPGGTAPDKLAFTLASGRRRVTPARFGRAFPRERPLPQLMRRCLLDDHAEQCVQVRLSAADAADPAARALLDTEAGTALRLHQVLGDTEYAVLFPRLIGYELDTAVPYLLYQVPRGAPVARTQVMAASDHQRFTRDLMLALCLLDGQGLVPRGVSPGTVLWDGARVQLWGLEAVVRSGLPRSPWGRQPYCSPEQRQGVGNTDVRDAVWSAAQVLYRLVTGRAGPADQAPADLHEHRVLDRTLRSAFAPRAALRPAPAEVLELVAPGAAHQVRLALPADETRTHREAFEDALRAKRRATAPGSRTPSGGEAEDGPAEVLCPYCLEPLRLDLTRLYVTDSKMQYERLDLSTVTNPLRRDDIMRGAVQKCTANADLPEHFIPVPYLMYGRPLTVAMVGQSSTGKSHLLTQMIAAVTDGGLEPFGLKWRSVNPEQHARFVRDRVQPLRSGQVLSHTAGLGMDDYARFVESLLITDVRGQVRPVAFFDLGGEDLVRTDAALRFLLGVDALVFVVDPALALPLPQLDHIRERWDVAVNRDGDLAFGTVLDRLRTDDRHLDVPAAVVLGKADLLRFQPPVDRWLSRPQATVFDPALVHEESRDVYGLLRRHAGQAWLRPFDAIRRCTLHIASATGGQEVDSRYPPGAGPRRVLEPLLALLAMHGMIEVPGGAEAFAMGGPPVHPFVPSEESMRDEGAKGRERR